MKRENNGGGRSENFDLSDSKTRRVEILTLNELKSDYPQIFHRSFSVNDLKSIRFCKADILGDYIIGTFAIPKKEYLSDEEYAFGYFATDEKLVFIDDTNYVKSTLEEMRGRRITEISSIYIFLLDFMEYILKDDMLFLLQYEEKLTRLEEELLDKKAENFDKEIFLIRKNLSNLGAYYEQISDVGETIRQETAENALERESALYGLLSDKAGRLYQTVQSLKEYSIQLREMHQTQIDIRQNEIMKFLTIVTTIFMPLTLITGWYGMNFSNMPELSFKYGYLIVCIICFVIIAAEIWIFGIKKWFK